MSLKTWKEEFYPTKANSPEALASPIEHSLRKWKGLTKKNLAKHRVWKGGRMFIMDEWADILSIDCESCALCINSTVKDECGTHVVCAHCPIYETLMKECNSEYFEWVCTGNPTPMISLLTRTLAASKTSTP